MSKALYFFQVSHFGNIEFIGNLFVFKECKMINNKLFTIFMCCGLLSLQIVNWRDSIKSNFLKTVIFWLFWVYSGSIVVLLSRLPVGGFDYLMSNISQPVNMFLLFILGLFSFSAAVSLIAADKVKASIKI